MRNLFNPEGPVMDLINRIVLTVWLNILWVVFSIPIITVGASTTALFTVTLKMAKNEEGSVTSQFFNAFRSNFRFSTKVWGILLAVGVLLAADGYVLYHLRFENAFWTLITAVYFVLLAAYAIELMYVFPLMAHFENTVRAMLINSIMIGMRFLLCTAMMAAIYFIMALIVIRFFTPAIIFGEGLCAFLCSVLLGGVLTRCEERTEEHQEEKQAEEKEEEQIEKPEEKQIEKQEEEKTENRE